MKFSCPISDFTANIDQVNLDERSTHREHYRSELRHYPSIDWTEWKAKKWQAPVIFGYNGSHAASINRRAPAAEGNIANACG